MTYLCNILQVSVTNLVKNIKSTDLNFVFNYFSYNVKST